MGNQTKLSPVVEPRPVLLSTHKKTRYSDSELEEFKILIEAKMKNAEEDLSSIKSCYMNNHGNGTEDTSPTFKAFEDGAAVSSRENNRRLAIRLEKFIFNLNNALIRIENKTYGICYSTGKLISKERLISVPHTTRCMEGKEIEEKKRNGTYRR